MIKTFKQSWLEEFFHQDKHKKVPTQLSSRLIRKLDMMNAEKEVCDLTSPPSNHLQQLHGARKGKWAISLNGPWRLCFRFDDGDIFDVELVQYH